MRDTREMAAMQRGRTLIAAMLVVAGLALATFFWLVFAITDCSADCMAAGERAVPLALVGTGFGLVVAGFLFRRSTPRAVASGFLAGGALGAVAIGWIMVSEGSRGQATWLLLVMVALAVVGAWMLRARGARRAVA